MSIMFILGSVAALIIIQVIAFWASGDTKNGVIDGLVAWGTLMLAGATFMLIWHNNKLTIKQKKERLLNEIIEWASEVGAKCAFETDPDEQFSEWTLKGVLDFQHSMDFINPHRIAFENGYKYVSWKGEYIKNIAVSNFKDKMASVGKLVDSLNQHLKMLHDDEIGKNSITTPKIAQKIAQDNLALDKLTRAVMAEAAKTKTELV